MSNQANDLFEGIINGLHSIGGGVIQHKIRQDASDIFDMAKNSIMNYYNPQQPEQPKPENTNAPMNIGAIQNGLPVTNNNQGQDNSKYDKTAYNNSQLPNRKQQDLYDYVDARGQLGQYGETGTPYINALDNLFNIQKKDTKRDIREGKDGRFIDFSDPNNPKEIYNTPKEVKPEAPPQLDYSLVRKDADGSLYYYTDKYNPQTKQMEQVNLRKLSPDDVTEYERLKDKELRQGDFAPKIGGLKKGGRGGLGKLDLTLDKKNEYDNIKKYYEQGTNWQNLTDQEKTDYIGEEQRLADKYTGGDVKKFQDFKEQLMKTPSKQAQKFFNDFTSQQTKQTQAGEKYTENDISEQGKQVTSLYNQLVSSLQSKTISTHEATVAFAKWYKENAPLLYPEIKKWIDEQIQNLF